MPLDAGMPLEHVRDAPEAELAPFDQSLLTKRMSRKRKAPDDEVNFSVKIRINKVIITVITTMKKLNIHRCKLY